jgi:hypothetical protein
MIFRDETEMALKGKILFTGHVVAADRGKLKDV